MLMVPSFCGKEGGLLTYVSIHTIMIHSIGQPMRRWQRWPDRAKSAVSALCPDFVDSGRSERTEADCPLIMTVDEYECLRLMVLQGSRSLWRIFHAATMDMEKDIAAENTVQIR